MLTGRLMCRCCGRLFSLEESRRRRREFLKEFHQVPIDDRYTSGYFSGVTDGALGNILIRGGCKTYGDIARSTDKELLAIYGIGPAFLRYTREGYEYALRWHLGNSELKSVGGNDG